MHIRLDVRMIGNKRIADKAFIIPRIIWKVLLIGIEYGLSPMTRFFQDTIQKPPCSLEAKQTAKM